jgi:hypothetical protein
MLISFVRLDTPAIGSYSAMDPGLTYHPSPASSMPHKSHFLLPFFLFLCAGYSSWIGLLVSDARVLFAFALSLSLSF